jgi:surface protein
MQLYEAVDAYLSEVDNGGFSNTSKVAVLHGYPIGKWDVSRITNFDRVFDPDRSLTLDPEWNPTRRTSFDADLGRWDTSNAVSMRGMFAASDEFVGQGLERWNVSKVEDFSYMFGWAAKFNGDLSQWDTSNAKRMDAMFFGAHVFGGKLSLWNVSKVTTMAHMFYEAFAFQGGDLTLWDVSSVVNMNSLFAAATRFNGNISTWDTSRVTDMKHMVSFVGLPCRSASTGVHRLT